jgi:CelD/BcsL family acetyltransferase involved in cellulose biosynthesis
MPMNTLALEQANSIFQQPWWLDAVAPGQWSEVTVAKGGQLKARLPFLEKRKWGLRILTHPRLSQTMGPWTAPLAGKTCKRLGEEKHLADALIEQLPECDYFAQAFHPSVTNFLPWLWKGFTQHTLYTYQLDDLTDLDAIWKNFGENVRNQVRKAETQIVINPSGDLETILDLNDMTFARQGLKAPYSREYVRRIEAACGPRNASLRLTAEDAQGRTHAALYLVHDPQSSHGLILAGDPALRNSGAGSLLLWQAIQMAARLTRTFDFGGSMLEPVETFFRNFGAKQVPYHHLSRMSRRMKLLMAARELGQVLRGKS